MVRWFLLSCSVCALLVLAGCADNKPKLVKVSGTVEVDGKPLPDGSVNLVGEGGSVPDTFKVTDGKFEGEAKLGKKKVEIRAFKQGKPTMMGDKPVEGSGVEQTLPDRFNTETTLTAEVTAGGLSPKDFKVESR